MVSSADERHFRVPRGMEVCFDVEHPLAINATTANEIVVRFPHQC